MDKIKKSEFLADFYCSECAAIYIKESVVKTSAALIDFANRLWDSIESAMEDEVSEGGGEWPSY